MGEAKRFYKPEEKLRIVLKGLSGTIQISELCRKYDIKPARFYHWKEKLLQSSQIFDDRGRKPNIDEKIRSKDEEIARLKDVIAEITQENLPIKKDWELRGKDMRYLISEVLDTVNTAVLRTAYPIRKILAMLGIAPSSYYSWLTPRAIDGRFNPFALRDEDIAYVSPSTVYAVLRRHGLVTTRKEKIFLSKERYHPVRPDEIWQCDIMYVKVKGRFFYLIVFIDVFSRYITHHALLRSMDADSAGLEAQKAIETLRKDSLAEP